MKFRSIIFLASFLLLFCGCGSNSKKDNPPQKENNIKNTTNAILEKENLKGDVVVLAEEHKVIYFNGNGFPEKELVEVQGLQGISYAVEYKYTINKIEGSLVKAKGFNVKTTYFYDSSGIITSSENVTKFDTQAETFSEKHFYKYNDDKNLISDSVNEARFIKYYHNGDKLDSSKDNLQTSIYSNGNLVKQVTHEVDENGNISQNTFVTTFEYNYDANGNWIQQKSIIPGKPEKVTNRTIIYKGQDFSLYKNKYDDFVTNLSSSNNSNPERLNNNSPNNGTSSNNQNNSQPSVRVEKQKVTCYKCGGSGIKKCSHCNGNGMVKCDYCFGTGRKYESNGYVTCRECNGQGRKNCRDCNGKGTTGSCSECQGRGYVMQ